MHFAVSVASTDQFFIQHRTPVDLLCQLQILHLVIQFPVGGTVLSPAVMEISHTESEKNQTQSAVRRSAEGSKRECGNDSLWQACLDGMRRILGVSAGMQSLYVLALPVTVQKKNSLSLYLISLRVLQPLGLVHIHEEILEQPLSLCQVVCIHLLVDQGLILPIVLCVLHKSKKLTMLLLH